MLSSAWRRRRTGLARSTGTRSRAAPRALPATRALVAFVLILAGLATKIGWAPVHNWLPDAHSEAPPPVSALLSAALLPTVLLVAWRVQATLGPAVGGATAGERASSRFGLASLVVAVPFLWRALPWKRLLAYSSLEHMGVIALGIGFGTPLAIAGVVLHVAGHALAKALGLLRRAAAAARRSGRRAPRARRGLAARAGRRRRRWASASARSAALPPSPLFVSRAADPARRASRPARSSWSRRRGVAARARLPRPRCTR